MISVQFNTIWHRQYVIIFGLMQFQKKTPWPNVAAVVFVLEASRKWCHCDAISGFAFIMLYI